jgi:molecular chaperone IbpA
MTSLKSAFFNPFNDFHKALDPYTVGFEKLFNELDEVSKNVAKTVTNYPPYNIKQISDNKYVIELAVAGFNKSDIEVELKGNKLTVSGKTKESEDETFLFKGIANRNFQRVFTISDTIEIKDAELVNGMLKVVLENMVKFNDSIKKIVIKD